MKSVDDDMDLNNNSTKVLKKKPQDLLIMAET